MMTSETRHRELTSGGEGPRGATLALVLDGVDEVGPLGARVEVLGEDAVIDPGAEGSHLLDGVQWTEGAQLVLHALLQRLAPHGRVVGCTPSIHPVLFM
jgi:hypothetical protein